MEITLEKVELVKDRTGVTYKEAKEALEAADGNVVDAIIAIEETVDINSKSKLGDKGQQLVDKMKEIVAKGKKKPIVLRKFHDLRCPVCKGYDEYRYCPMCGQRIDWSEQECTGSSEDEYNTVRNSKGE